MSFETFFLGREKIRNPFVREMISIGKELADKGIGREGNMSVRYGSRIIITARNADMGSLTESDFVEVADYDVVRNVALVIGQKEPSAETIMHWLIYRREDINAIIHIHNTFEKLPTTEKEKPSGSFEIALEVLKSLKNSRCINLRNHGCIAVGKSLREAREEIACL
ncbi:MAG: class II aldolase/adducin family protein [Candidatus Thermoplasmatota archaeon]|nr:class II aldolase/adducin family protein [Candidatus Thermoplasmatota archaeon]